MMLDVLALAEAQNVARIITTRMLLIQDDTTTRLVFTRLNGGRPVLQMDCKPVTRNTT